MIKNKYYFIADTHLGVPNYQESLIREKKLVSFLLEAEKDAKAIYLMGDIFDFWHEYKYVVPKYYVRLLGTLALIVDRGTKVYFFTGNHDQWIRDYFQKEIGMIVCTKEIVQTIEGKTFYLAHGDGLDKTDKKYLFVKALFGSKFIRVLFASIHPRWAIAFANSWSKASRKSHSIEDLVDKGSQEAMYKFSKKIIEEKPIDYFIFGHRHLNKEYVIENNKKLIILSEWINNSGYAVWDGENLELKSFE
ncbi:MAG: UDP-2,3-diacylglucosamine diphosphatase [Bacteroidales bacterium]|jgi:UDP-2,3-diacylglucosamine hydrolase|nr:UDP-2,3-diacylglucosamine diphosphatase [Bacteroidales bacterium]MDD4703374.1 UDP-2,3-diacylglucosamine diphosphatase [Bacteroidales bacterium]MDX9798392.1 UDP-2,3-diacylglucosamine diphosphatase [Bacteroidales bacterium]